MLKSHALRPFYRFQSAPVGEDGGITPVGAVEIEVKRFNPPPSVRTGEFCLICAFANSHAFQSAPVGEDGGIIDQGDVKLYELNVSIRPRR